MFPAGLFGGGPLQTGELTGKAARVRLLAYQSELTLESNRQPLTVILGFQLLNQPKHLQDDDIGANPKNAHNSIPHPLQRPRTSFR